MSCDLLSLTAQSARTAIAAARTGSCDFAHDALARAGRDLLRAKGKGAMTPCKRVFAKAVKESFESARRQVRARCPR
jgi:hypothetical protein